ncbi:hypothetical protein KY310_00715 [Candidatus Woesearchaeota archaeon]|nr:hypothetical protein [Candidatus Woesearchaeota archaeon]
MFDPKAFYTAERLHDMLVRSWLKGDRTPAAIQKFFDALEYDFKKASLVEKGRKVKLRDITAVVVSRKAICIEASIAGCLMLPEKYYPIVLNMSRPDNLGHSVCSYRDPETRLIGAVGFSRDKHLREREPKYRTRFELAQSYRCKEYDFETISFLKPSAVRDSP